MNPLDLLEAPMRAILEFFHGLGFTWGWAIVMLTLLVRLILLPLFVKQYKSARRMQEVAPQMKELQRKYKGNKPKLQEEMMKFYKENDVNPFGSCLPLVAQAPIFIALYYTLRNSASTFQDGTDLGFLHAIPNISSQLNEVGWGVIPLVTVYALSQLISSELSSTAAMSKNQRWLMRLLPIGIVFFVFQFPVPAGVVIYWATTNLWTAGQQLVLKRRIEAEMESQDTNGASTAVAATDLDDDEGVDDEPADTATDASTTTAAAARAVPKRRRRKGDPPPPPPPMDDVQAEPDEPSQPVSGGNGSTSDKSHDTTSKRTPPARKKGPGGGPSRPAGKKKPPKRRK